MARRAAPLNDLFHLRRDRLPATERRATRARAFAIRAEVAGVEAAAPTGNGLLRRRRHRPDGAHTDAQSGRARGFSSSNRSPGPGLSFGVEPPRWRRMPQT